MGKTDTSHPLRFEPFSLLRRSDAQTIGAYFLNRPMIPAASRLITVPLPDGDRLAIWEDAQRNADTPRGAVLLAHGLGGSAAARYMLSAALRLTEAGYIVFRMNHRGAGEGAGLARRMYHAGLSGDIRAAASLIGQRHPTLPLVCLGFSMSGNTVLKFAGEAGDADAALISGVVAVNPAVDMDRCVRSIEQRRNRVYQNRFTKLLVSQLAKNRGRCDAPERLSQITSIRSYDNLVTAPAWGFEDATEYYRTQSAVIVVPSIAVPTIVLTADDDPIIPVGMFSEVRWPDGVRLHVAEGGGHMGYYSRERTPLGDRRWLDYFVVNAVTELLR